MRFKVFLENEETDDVRGLLDKIPKSHASLVKGYTWHFQSGNTLKGDNEHVAVIDHHQKTITLAAPWNYPRSHTALHEIGHLVWNKHMTDNLKEEWKRIVQATKNKQDQNDQELFCHAYAATYSKNKISIHNHQSWSGFIKNKVPH
jgi:hypothetical protein